MLAKGNKRTGTLSRLQANFFTGKDSKLGTYISTEHLGYGKGFAIIYYHPTTGFTAYTDPALLDANLLGNFHRNRKWQPGWREEPSP